MAQAPSGEHRLVELRGVGPGYPLAGQVVLRGAGSLTQAFAPGPGGATGAAVEPALLDRLGLKLGDPFMVGDAHFIARAVLVSEPDRIGRFALGPRVLTSLDAVERSGLLQPGGLYSETARIVLPPGVATRAATRRLRQALAGSGFDIRDRYDAAPGARRLIDRLEYFLGFIGLAALLAGGLGVFGAVSAYLETRKPSIAVLKALGAEGPLIRDVYLIQIALLAAVGVAIGLAIGRRATGDQLAGARPVADPGPVRGLSCPARSRPAWSACCRPPPFRWSPWRGRARRRRRHCSCRDLAGRAGWGAGDHRGGGGGTRALAGPDASLTAPTPLTAAAMILAAWRRASLAILCHPRPRPAGSLAGRPLAKKLSVAARSGWAWPISPGHARRRGRRRRRSASASP